MVYNKSKQSQKNNINWDKSTIGPFTKRIDNCEFPVRYTWKYRHGTLINSLDKKEHCWRCELTACYDPGPINSAYGDYSCDWGGWI